MRLLADRLAEAALRKLRAGERELPGEEERAETVGESAAISSIGCSRTGEGRPAG
jgi:hypothetical protein